MTNAKKLELSLIPLTGIIVWFMGHWLPAQINLSRLLLMLSAVLLLQSLIRDVSILIAQKHNAKSGPKRTAQCLCVESIIGVIGIIIGSALFALGIDYTITMNQSFWSILVMAILVVGFAVKDYIIQWSPWRIRRDSDHMNIIVSWKK